MITNIMRPLLAGVLHSFEPDHVTAVSVLAAEKAITREKTKLSTVFKASQWALGHSVTLLLFGGIALFFKSTMELAVHNISWWAEVSLGPIMIWLGIVAIRRNHQINDLMKNHKKIDDHDHTDSNPIHLHGKSGEEIAMNPLSKSFYIGLLHGLAGTGGVLTSALVISADSIGEAVMVLMVESLGIVLAMGVYSYSLIFITSRFIEKHLVVFKVMNAAAGSMSILLGAYWIFRSVMDM